MCLCTYIAIKEWHAYNERQVDGLKAKIRSLEAQLQDQMSAGGAGGAGGAVGLNESWEGQEEASQKELKQKELKQKEFKRCSWEGVESGDGGIQALEQLLKDKERQV